MRKVILYIATSLDNFIAESDGSTEWLHDPRYAIPNEDYGYGQLMSAIDTTLMGHASYKIIDGFDIPFPYADKINYVFTRQTGLQETEFVKFIIQDPAEFVRELKNMEGKDIWLIGGGQINTLLLNAGLIDELILTIAPVTLGEGIPLFATGLDKNQFDLIDNKSYKSGMVQMTYVPL